MINSLPRRRRCDLRRVQISMQVAGKQSNITRVDQVFGASASAGATQTPIPKVTPGRFPPRTYLPQMRK